MTEAYKPFQDIILIRNHIEPPQSDDELKLVDALDNLTKHIELINLSNAKYAVDIQHANGQLSAYKDMVDTLLDKIEYMRN